MLNYPLFGVIWNVFLAVIPVALAYTIQGIYCKSKESPSGIQKTVMLILGLGWLAFAPNTCYLLTEWRHFLDTIGYSRLWAVWQVNPSAAYDLILYTFFYAIYSGIGVFTFTLAIRPVAKVARRMGATLWVWAVPFFMLMAVGVYLGLILRFNSWNLIDRLDRVWYESVQVLNRPVLFSFVTALAVFLWIVYFCADVWIDGLLARFKNLRQANTGCKENK